MLNTTSTGKKLLILLVANIVGLMERVRAKAPVLRSYLVSTLQSLLLNCATSGGNTPETLSL